MRTIRGMFKIKYLIMIMLMVISCAKENDISNLNETIFIRYKNADMPAYIYGNGSEKVFLITLHGGPGGLGLSFRGAAFNRIEENYVVVYFDQRGSGMSQGSYSDDDINIDVMAEDVMALVSVLKQKYGIDSRFFLLGHSWGGTLGTATVLMDQSVFLGWIQVDGTHNPRDMYTEYKTNFQNVAIEQINLGNSISFWESVNDLVLDVQPTFNQNDITRLNDKAFDAEEKLASDNVIDQPDPSKDIFFKYNLLTAYWNIGNIQSILDPKIQGILSYTDRLSEITIPSLILWGEHDMVVPKSFAQEAYENLGSSVKHLVFFGRSAHTPFLSEPNLFSEEVILFIDKNK